MEKSFVERRGWPRTVIHKVNDEAQLVLPIFFDEPPPPAEVVNFSIAGAGVLLSGQIKKGTQVKLLIQGTELPALDLEAEVRWVAGSPVSTGKYPAGLKFFSLEQPRRNQLQALIELMRKHHIQSE